MSYEFQSKHHKNPHEKKEHEHHCCHHPSKEELLKKKQPLSADKPSGEYTYNSPYTNMNSTPQEEDYCCHHEDLHHETCNLQERNALQRQQKSIDLIRRKLEEEAQKRKDLEDKNGDKNAG